MTIGDEHREQELLLECKTLRRLLGRIAELEQQLCEQPFTCPVCNGAQIVSRPPGVPGDISSWASTTCATYECPVCKGKGIIWGATRSLALAATVSEEAPA
jgi:hypothetical protein